MPIPVKPSARAGRLSIVDGSIGGIEAVDAFAEAVKAGLQGRPRTLPCRYLYDDEGSRLFEAICDLPEYYLTRTEDAILRDHAGEMVSGWIGDPVMVELGSGSSIKTRRLIDAAMSTYGQLCYVPIDVSRQILEDSARALVADYPNLRVTGYAANYRDAMVKITGRYDRPKLIVFLGSSLGNYDAAEAADLLGLVARSMDPADRLLLGTDLDKDPRTLEAAYDDAQGVTARFNLNILARINRELGGNFDLGRFRHEARYNDRLRRVEMHLVSLDDQEVSIPSAGVVARFAEGDSIHTENSHKYTAEGLADLAGRSGFTPEASWTDQDGRFLVQRWRPQVAID